MLIQSLFTSNTGIQSATNFLDVTSNNLANLNTTGFKSGRINFQDLLYLTLLGGVNANGVSGASNIQTGTGVATGSIAGLFTQGPLQLTNGTLDVAINGDGFFRLQQPDGSIVFSRDGNFSLAANGALVNSDGLLLSPNLIVPAGSSSVSIGADGIVSAITPASNGAPVVIGQIQLTRFINPQGLLRLGDNLFAQTQASGNPIVGAPASGSFGLLQQGFLEGSNVDSVSELTNLIIAQNTLTFNTAAFTTANQMIQSTLELI